MASSDRLSFDRLFDPDAVALIGASADPEKLAGRPHRYLDRHGYGGDVYLVNPGRDEIDGRPCYDSIADVPDPVDVAMVLVPAAVAPTVIEECGREGVPFALVIASGFAETDDEGVELQERLEAAARDGGVRIVGPNAQGMLNLDAGVTLSFSSMLRRDDLSHGGLSFVTQSGAFGGALFQLTQNVGVGTSKWLSTGNEADVTTVEVLDYLVDDPDTDVVVTYLESLRDGDRFHAIGHRAAETDTAIVAMRVGASARGREAAASHTGSVATDDDVYGAVFEQAGVTRIFSVDEFVDAVTAFSRVPTDRYPPVDTPAVGTEPTVGVGAISVSGGAAVLIADTCDRVGLPLATLSDDTEAAIRDEIPPYGSETNPVDVTGTVISNPAMFERCVRAIAGDESVGGLLLQFGNTGDETIEECKDLLFTVQSEYQFPVVTVFTGATPTEETAHELREEGVLAFEDPVRGVETLAKLWNRAAFRAESRTKPVPEPLATSGRASLPTDDGWPAVVEALSGTDVSFVDASRPATVHEAVTAAEELGYPVALKLDPVVVPHKSEVDGVKTGLSDATAVRRAYEELTATGDPVLVQPMVDGVEVIVGVVDDPDFGPVMLVGPGGVFVELFDDFAYRGLPVDESTARAMITETAVDDLLGGFRDRPPSDRDALAGVIAGVSEAYRRFDVAEFECNPVVVTETDAVAVDLLVR